VTQETKAMTVRIPAEQAAELEAVARVDGIAVSEAVRDAIGLLIESRRKDAAFRERIKRMVEQDRALLDRLGTV
jgi:Arc/MetJ-type ribon-helix-helix transcriptional regulator